MSSSRDRQHLWSVSCSSGGTNNQRSPFEPSGRAIGGCNVECLAVRRWMIGRCWGYIRGPGLSGGEGKRALRSDSDGARLLVQFTSMADQLVGRLRLALMEHQVWQRMHEKPCFLLFFRLGGFTSPQAFDYIVWNCGTPTLSETGILHMLTATDNPSNLSR